MVKLHIQQLDHILGFVLLASLMFVLQFVVLVALVGLVLIFLEVLVVAVVDLHILII
jgi:hypothetical protein